MQAHVLPFAEGQLNENGHLKSDSLADVEVSRDGKPVSLVVPGRAPLLAAGAAACPRPLTPASAHLLPQCGRRGPWRWPG